MESIVRRDEALEAETEKVVASSSQLVVSAGGAAEESIAEAEGSLSKESRSC